MSEKFHCFNFTIFNDTTYWKKYYCSKIEINITSCEPVQTPEEMDTIQSICEAANIVWYVGFWFSLVTGVLGNGLAILTIASLPTSPATFFVGLLAISDFIALCLLALFQYLFKYKVLGRATKYWDLFPMMFDFVASFSNWLLVLICLERFFTVRFPLQKRYYFTLRHAQVSALVLFLGLFALYNITTWTVGYKDLRMFQLRNVMYAGLPLALILVIIGLISYQLRRIHKDRKILNGRVHSRLTLSRLEDSPSSGTDQARKRQGKTNTLDEIARLENSITLMMMVAAVCFSLLTIPNCFLLTGYSRFTVSMNTPVLRPRWKMLYTVSQVLTYLNLSVNFLLYFMSAKKFRRQLYKVVIPRTLSFRRSISQPTPGANNSTSETTPMHHGANGDYVMTEKLEDTTAFQLDSLTVTPEHKAVQQEISQTYPMLYSEMSNGTAGAKL